MMPGIVPARMTFGTISVSVPPASPEVRFELCRVIISEVHDQQVIMLKEIEGNRIFPIVIGIIEATAIDRTYRQLPLPRPLTHDAWLASLIAVGARIQAACIKELRDNTYLATLRLVHTGQLIEVDVRPSDAVHMARKAKAPIFIAEAIVAEVCGSER
jgi:bifunctional DNase/RNase